MEPRSRKRSCRTATVVTPSVPKGAGYDFKAFIDGTGDGYLQAYEVWKHIGDWNSTADGFNLTQVDGNLGGVDFNLFDSDYDSDGFTNWQETKRTNQNDANSTPGLDFGLVGYWPFDGNASTPPIMKETERQSTMNEVGSAWFAWKSSRVR